MHILYYRVAVPLLEHDRGMFGKQIKKTSYNGDSFYSRIQDAFPEDKVHNDDAMDED